MFWELLLPLIIGKQLFVSDVTKRGRTVNMYYMILLQIPLLLLPPPPSDTQTPPRQTEWELYCLTALNIQSLTFY